jgi:ADP-heptose:LPS heptosyltransferase/GT2 family glycosyltransferase
VRSDSILILCLDTYGDLTLRQPLFRSLLDAGCRVGLVVTTPYERLLPFLDGRLEYIPSDLRPYDPPQGDFWIRAAALQAEIERWRPDLLVCGPYTRTPLDQFLLRRSRVPSLGFVNPKRGDADLDALILEPAQDAASMTRALSIAEETREADKNRVLLEAILGPLEGEYQPSLRLAPEDEARAIQTLERLGLDARGFAFAAPAGAVTTNGIKSWPREVFLAVVEHLERRHGLRTLVTGIAAEAPVLEDLIAAGAERGLRLAQWLGGPDDLGELLGLIRWSRLYLGRDTGPMHFAAALDVPVLALFGGGHWPRFLPAAKRSFIATHELPCFGCEWECWLPEPACITTVDTQVLLDGADWLLAETTPERRLELGRPLASDSQELIRAGAARYRRTSRRALDAEHRGRVLEWQRQAFEAQAQCLAQDRRVLEERLEASDLQATRVQLWIQQREAHVRAQDDYIRLLTAQVEHLSRAPAAFRILSAAALKRVGLFDVARRGRELMMAASDRPSTPIEPAALPVEAAPAAQRLPLLEAFVLARGLREDTEDVALERLYQLGMTLPSILCVHPTPKNAQAALMLASGGAQVAWLGEESALHGVSAAGLSVPAPDLGSWLIASGGSAVPQGTALLLDASGDAEILRLLHGRLAADTVVLVNGDSGSAPWAGGLAASPDYSLPGLSVFNAPPRAWQDPTRDRPEQLPSGRPWPRLTVVTVSLNQGRYLEETLQSVLGQGYPNLEYIVVDGGSTDDSREILERYRQRLAHCIVEPDEGQADALNKGFALATGEILAWLNSDDRYPAGALWRAAIAFDSYAADMVVGGCRLARDDDADTASVHHPRLPVGRVVPLPLERLLDLDGSWLKGDFFYQPEVFWTRDIWRRSGARLAPELFYSMDYELWARMAREGARIVHVPDTLAVYRVHEAQKTAGADLPYLPELRRVALELRRQSEGS